MGAGSAVNHGHPLTPHPPVNMTYVLSSQGGLGQHVEENSTALYTSPSTQLGSSKSHNQCQHQEQFRQLVGLAAVELKIDTVITTNNSQI